MNELPIADFEFEMSNPCGQFAAALAKAQLSMTAVVKDKQAKIKHKNGGGEHTYWYADLESLVQSVRKPLNENGIAVVQAPSTTGRGKVVITTMLIHESGEWSKNRLTMDVLGTDPQAVGSAITYGRRYALGAMTGQAPEDDDDGAAASRQQEQSGDAGRDRRPNSNDRRGRDRRATANERHPPKARDANEDAATAARRKLADEFSATLKAAPTEAEVDKLLRQIAATDFAEEGRKWLSGIAETRRQELRSKAPAQAAAENDDIKTVETSLAKVGTKAQLEKVVQWVEKRRLSDAAREHLQSELAKVGQTLEKHGGIMPNLFGLQAALLEAKTEQDFKHLYQRFVGTGGCLAGDQKHDGERILDEAWEKMFPTPATSEAS